MALKFEQAITRHTFQKNRYKEITDLEKVVKHETAEISNTSKIPNVKRYCRSLLHLVSPTPRLYAKLINERS